MRGRASRARLIPDIRCLWGVDNLPRPVEVDATASIRAKTFSYSYQARVGDNATLSIDWHFKPLARSVLTEDVEDYIADRDRMTGTTWRSWDLTREGVLERFLRIATERAEERAAEAARP